MKPATHDLIISTAQLDDPEWFRAGEIAGWAADSTDGAREFDKEEPTRPIVHMTISEVAKRSNGGRVEIAFSERPTRDLRPPSKRRK